jgi:hypothetical protein
MAAAKSPRHRDMVPGLPASGQTLRYALAPAGESGAWRLAKNRGRCLAFRGQRIAIRGQPWTTVEFLVCL